MERKTPKNKEMISLGWLTWQTNEQVQLSIKRMTEMYKKKKQKTKWTSQEAGLGSNLQIWTMLQKRWLQVIEKRSVTKKN